MIRLACIAVVLIVGVASSLLAQDAEKNHPVLRVVYFTPIDRKPEPDRVERLDRVMSEVQRFFREGMQMQGYGPLTFELDRDDADKLRVLEVAAKGPMRDYGRNDAGKVRDEVKASLAKSGIDIDRETIIIFQQLLDWKGKVATEIGPYVGGGDAHGGTAWVYDDAKLDPKLLASKDPGGYYHRPCSIGQFNTHYIGGVAHELGHALGLPHERERPVETERLGNSLMGAGNHTYGNELRGEGKGTFLSAAGAAPLAVHPLFTGKKLPRVELTNRLVELKPTLEKGKLTLEGRLADGPKIASVIAYSDPQEVGGDYDSFTGVSKVDADGRFRLTIEDLKPGICDLRLRLLAESGDTRYFSFIYEIDREGMPHALSLLEAPWLTEAYAAYQSGDKQRMAKLVTEAKGAAPEAKTLHRKIAHYQKLQAAKEPIALDSLPAETKTVLLADVKFSAAATGWGPPVRNQVSGNGDASGLLEVGSQFFESGLYAHAPARHVFDLGGGWKTLETKFGMQDRHAGSVVFVIKADGKELFRSEPIKDHKLREATVSVVGVKRLELVVENAGDGNSSDWGVWIEPQLSR